MGVVVAMAYRDKAPPPVRVLESRTPCPKNVKAYNVGPALT